MAKYSLPFKPETLLFVKITALVGSIIVFFITKDSEFSIIAYLFLPIAFLLFLNLLKMMNKAQLELKEFTESIYYRDFSRNFNIQEAPSEVRSLRQGFNEINSTLRVISRERETQFLYLQQILELVDVGILSYEPHSGKQNWTNQAFKKMFGIPYLKTIQTLKLRDQLLYETVENIRPGQTQVITVHSENRTTKILVVASFFQTEGITNKLVAFQNINLALEENEAQAWHRLLSVMTHEIMNSVAPISSLAGTLKNRIEEAGNSWKEEDLEDLAMGLETIERRSEGLMKFAQSYRNLNKPLTANVQTIQIRDIFETMITLLQPTLEQKGILLEVVLNDPKLKGTLDVELIEQMLINLIANASDATKNQEEKRISLFAGTENGRLLIRVSDNGGGIPPELLDRIFVPFFSTKKTGSGIGLSLCKQIMLLHKGQIEVKSEVGKGSVFELIF
jgi:signal transduction histidine kinase